jgi:hypothetical protein
MFPSGRSSGESPGDRRDDEVGDVSTSGDDRGEARQQGKEGTVIAVGEVAEEEEEQGEHGGAAQTEQVKCRPERISRPAWIAEEQRPDDRDGAHDEPIMKDDGSEGLTAVWHAQETEENTEHREHGQKVEARQYDPSASDERL